MADEKQVSGSSGYVIKDSGSRHDFGTGAVRDVQVGKGDPSLLPADVILKLSEFYEAGCQKYGPRNWEQGIPLVNYFNSAMRHSLKLLRGDTDEAHEMAWLWNVACYIQTKVWIEQGVLPKFLDNMPKKRLPIQEVPKVDTANLLNEAMAQNFHSLQVGSNDVE